MCRGQESCQFTEEEAEAQKATTTNQSHTASGRAGPNVGGAGLTGSPHGNAGGSPGSVLSPCSSCSQHHSLLEGRKRVSPVFTTSVSGTRDFQACLPKGKDEGRWWKEGTYRRGYNLTQAVWQSRTHARAPREYRTRLIAFISC